MYYVGVDIAKEKHYVCILDDAKELACKPFWIYSDILGLKERYQLLLLLLIQRLKKYFQISLPKLQ